MIHVNDNKKIVGNCIRAVRHNIEFISLIITLHHNKFQPTLYEAILNIM